MRRFPPAKPTRDDRLARLETLLANMPDAKLFAATVDDIRRVVDVPAKDAEYRLLIRQQRRRAMLETGAIS